MRFASLTPRCGRPQPLLSPRASALTGASTAPQTSPAAQAPTPAAPQPPASLEDWVQRARGCGAL
ncbi:MAG: hypothetical protein ACT4NV_19905 [Rhodoferax sp.]